MRVDGIDAGEVRAVQAWPEARGGGSSGGWCCGGRKGHRYDRPAIVILTLLRQRVLPRAVQRVIVLLRT